MTDPTTVALAVDAAVASVPGVEQAYVAAPPIAQAVEALASRRTVLSHVTVVPRAVRASIGVRSDESSRAVAQAVSAAVRVALPDDWADAKVHVQVRRIEVG